MRRISGKAFLTFFIAIDLVNDRNRLLAAYSDNPYS